MMIARIDKLKEKMMYRHEDNKAIVDKLNKKFQAYFKLDDLIVKLDKVFEENSEFQN